MSNDTSVIRHTAERRILVLDEDYLRICSVPVVGIKHDAHCTAIVLRQMEYWYCVRVKHRPQSVAQNTAAQKAGDLPLQNTDFWVYKSQREMQDELMGSYGEKAITAAYSYLVARGFLTTRQNPHVAYDRTKQYLFMREQVQAAVDNMSFTPPENGNPPASDKPEDAPIPFRKNAEWNTQNCGVESAEISNAFRENTVSNPQKYGNNTKDYTETIAENQQQQHVEPVLNDESSVVVALLIQKGVSGANARKFVASHDLNWLQEQVAALRYRHPQNPGKVLTDAIQEEWDFPPDYKQSKKPRPRVASPDEPKPQATGVPPPDLFKKGNRPKDLAEMKNLFPAGVIDAIAEPDPPPSPTE